ncbi:MAG: uroporphyrinogen-III C-methyltransferase [Gammaproteobacteria bacterium]|nr:uroporphyrinogen-III C-methyltransferase [Gammaproteobacteria bacterium]
MAGAKSNPPGKAAAKKQAGVARKAASAGHPPAKAGSPKSEQAAPRKRRLWWLWLWLIPLIVAAAGFWLGYGYLAGLPSRVAEIEQQVAEIGPFSARLEAFENRRDKDAAQQAADNEAARRASERLRDALEARLAAAERALESLGGRPAGQQARWRLDEAENLLALAHRQSRFARDYEGAALAVRDALDLLAQAGDLRYGAIQAELQEQARALERMPARDIQGVVVRLGALLARTEGLKPDLGPSLGAASGAEALPGQGWERALASTRRALRSLVTVRRTEGGVNTLLADTDTETLWRLLAAELHLARLAYIQGDLQAYAASLVAARGRLARLYAGDDPEVSDTLADIDELLGLAQGPEAPDIASSLQRLRSIRSE